jgi:RNA polymerase sigma factor (sigma-70 family)
MPSDETWEATLNRVLPQALALAARVCGSVPAAEDAMQEGLVKIIQARESYRGQAQLSTWMLQIVLNASRDWLRKQRATSERESHCQATHSSVSLDGQGSAGSTRSKNKPVLPGAFAGQVFVGQVFVGGIDLDQLANSRTDDPWAGPIQAE